MQCMPCCVSMSGVCVCVSKSGVCVCVCVFMLTQVCKANPPCIPFHVPPRRSACTACGTVIRRIRNICWHFNVVVDW